MVRSLAGTLWLAAAGVIILAAVMTAIGRVALPYADTLRPDLEAWLSEALDRPVSIGRISAGLSGLGPDVLIEDVRLGEGGEAIRVARADIGIDALRSVLRRAPYVRRLELGGLRIEVLRDADGMVSVAGLPVLPDARDGGTVHVPAWVLPQGRMTLSDAELVVIDRTAPAGAGEYRLTDVAGEVRSASGRFQAQGRATPEPALGSRIAFAIDVNAGTPAGMVTELWVEGEGLRPAGFLAGRDPGGLAVREGRLHGRAWLVWRGGALRGVDGEVFIDDLAVAPATAPAGPHAIDAPDVSPVGSPNDSPGDSGADAAGESAPAALGRVGGRFAWRSQGPGWRLDVDHLVLGDGPGDDDAPGRGPRRLAAASGIDGAPPDGVVARLDAARLEAVLPVLALSGLAPEPLAAALAGLNPTGLARDLEVRYQAGEGGEPRFTFRARFEDVASEAWSGVPGLADLGGDLRMDERGGAIGLEAGPRSSPSFDLFRNALPVSRLDARIEWARADRGWRVLAPRVSFRNEDLTLRARARVDWPLGDDGEPEVALYADFEAGSVENVSRYLPAAIMPDGAVGWLDRAIVAGRVPGGELTWHGPLRGFPYDEGQGLLRVDFDLRGGELDYADGWPRIEGIDADIVFEGRRMEIAAEGARMLATALGPVQVTMDDLTAGPPILVVDGRTRGPVGDVLRILRETPLAERYGRYVEDASGEGEGEGELALRLELPIGAPDAVVEGALDFDRSLLRIGDGVELADIEGRLHFSGRGLEGRGIRTRVLGLPARVDIHPAQGAGEAVRIEARGSADAAAIGALIGTPAAWLYGQTAWQARLVIPPGEAFAERGLALDIRSALEGLAIRLPAPLGKTAAEPELLEVTMRLPRTPERPVRARLGERAAFALGFDEAGTGVARAGLRFGAGPAALPAQGVRVAGRIERVDVAEWRDALQAGGGGDAGPAGLGEVDLDIAVVRMFGRDVHDARIAARAGDARWTVDVESREIKGRIEAPLRQGPPWRADLEYLHLATPEGGAPATVDPRLLPPVRIASERFTYDGRDLGRLSLRANPAMAGLRLDELRLTSPALHVDARGDWVVVDSDQYSSFNIDFTSSDVGRALAGLGYAGTIRGGQGSSNIVARWDGPPTAFSLEGLNGLMSMSIADGRLLEVEPGAGRIFGLISLQALPRRLTLDFSDFFGRGFSFDHIGGGFEVRDGVARTTDLAMEGPAARVTAHGAVNLATRRYDQTITVVPSVGAGLPVAAVVAGGVGIGAAMLLMERVFKDDIERITRMRYRVTGPWDEPVVERLQDAVRPDTR